MKQTHLVDIQYFPDYLRIMRVQSKMTQKELADKAGCYVSSISQWENGLRQPSYEMMQRLAKALGKRLQLVFADNT